MNDQIQAYRYGMLKNMNAALRRDCEQKGIAYDEPTQFVIMRLAGVSIELNVSAPDLAAWKRGWPQSNNHFPTEKEFTDIFTQDFSGRIAALAEQLNLNPKGNNYESPRR